MPIEDLTWAHNWNVYHSEAFCSERRRILCNEFLSCRLDREYHALRIDKSLDSAEREREMIPGVKWKSRCMYCRSNDTCVASSRRSRSSRCDASACRCVSYCQIRIYVKRARTMCLHAFMHRIIRADDEDGYRVTHSFSRLSRVEEVSMSSATMNYVCMHGRRSPRATSFTLVEITQIYKSDK